MKHLLSLFLTVCGWSILMTLGAIPSAPTAKLHQLMLRRCWEQHLRESIFRTIGSPEPSGFHSPRKTHERLLQARFHSTTADLLIRPENHNYGIESAYSGSDKFLTVSRGQVFYYPRTGDWLLCEDLCIDCRECWITNEVGNNRTLVFKWSVKLNMTGPKSQVEVRIAPQIDGHFGVLQTALDSRQSFEYFGNCESKKSPKTVIRTSYETLRGRRMSAPIAGVPNQSWVGRRLGSVRKVVKASSEADTVRMRNRRMAGSRGVFGTVRFPKTRIKVVSMNPSAKIGDRRRSIFERYFNGVNEERELSIVRRVLIVLDAMRGGKGPESQLN